MILKSFLFRHVVSAALAVFIAVFVNHYFSFSNESWIVLTAFLTSQTTRGTPLRQGIIFLFIVIAAILLASILQINISHQMIIYIIAALVFMVFAIVTMVNAFLQNKTYFILMLFPLILLIAIFQPMVAAQLVQNRLLDVLIGSILGIACSQLILPIRLDKEFSSSMLPILRALLDYSQVLTQGFLRDEAIHSGKSINALIIERKCRVEKILQANQGTYPEWAYEVGFNPGLRSGFRFFLINVERMTEIFFSMDYLTTRNMDTDLLENLSAPILLTMQKNDELLTILINYFESGTFTETNSDFTSDIADLENAVRNIIPNNLALLDISPYYLTITAFIRDMKDMRGLLLQLLMSLPSSKHA